MIKYISILIVCCSPEQSPPLLALVLWGELTHKGDDEVFNSLRWLFTDKYMGKKKKKVFTIQIVDYKGPSKY